jgi:hypothetical protein
MAMHIFWVFLITCCVAAFDYHYRSIFDFKPEFFQKHHLSDEKRLFFLRYGQAFRFGGLIMMWAGLLSCYSARVTENSLFLYGGIAMGLIGAMLHLGEVGWLFLMKKKSD